MELIKKYFETFTSDTTIRSYKSVLRLFFSQIYEDGELDDQVEKYVHDKRDHEEDIRQFFISINGFSPTTVRQYLNILKNFIEYLRSEEFPRRFIKDLLRRRKGTRPITDDRAPTTEELRSILSHLDLKGTALVLSLVSSGMRVGEALKINISDLDLDKNPVEVSIRAEYTKTGNKRLTFLSQEAKEHILQWLRVRESYMESSHKRNYGIPRNNSEDMRLFPFSESTARTMWNLALDKAGLGEKDPTTKYRKIRVHSLRKLFKTQLSMVEGAGEMPDGLLGHIDAYLRYSPQEYREFYLRAEYTVTIFGGADLKELAETQSEIRNLKDMTLEDHAQLLNLLKENQDLKRLVENLAERLGSLEGLRERIEELEDYVEIGVLRKVEKKLEASSMHAF